MSFFCPYCDNLLKGSPKSKTDPNSKVFSCKLCEKSFELSENGFQKLNTYLGKKGRVTKINASQSSNNRSNTASNNFRCSQCNKNFSSLAALNQHCKVKKHTQEHLVKCPHCIRSFKTKSARNQHIKSKHKRFLCSECDQWFSSEKTLKNHKNNVHDKVKCPYCGKLRHKSGLEKHIESVHEYKCPHCAEKYTTQFLLQTHIEKTHREKIIESFICHTCKKVLKSKKALDKHLQSAEHLVELMEFGKSITCPHCEKTFKTKKDLVNHITSTNHSLSNQETQDDGVTCPICEKHFNSGKALMRHLSIKHKKTQNDVMLKLKGVAIFEKRTLSDRFFTLLRKIFSRKKVIVMDECVGNDSSIVDALSDRFNVCPLPKVLNGTKDPELRVLFKKKRWGLVSKDYEMVMLAREMRIKPVFFLTEKRKHKDLIRISKGNYIIHP